MLVVGLAAGANALARRANEGYGIGQRLHRAHMDLVIGSKESPFLSDLTPVEIASLAVPTGLGLGGFVIPAILITEAREIVVEELFGVVTHWDTA